MYWIFGLIIFVTWLAADIYFYTEHFEIRFEPKHLSNFLNYLVYLPLLIVTAIIVILIVAFMFVIYCITSIIDWFRGVRYDKEKD